MHMAFVCLFLFCKMFRKGEADLQEEKKCIRLLTEREFPKKSRMS